MPLIRSRPLSSLWRDRRGVSAVEFAFIAPVLVIFYFGMAELTEAMIAQRRLNHLTSSIGDVVARDTRLTDARRDDLFKLGPVLMDPFPSAALSMCLVSIASDANGKDKVVWSEPFQSPKDCPSPGAPVDIPVSVLPAGQTVIMSKASYDYNSMFKLILPNTITLRRTFYLRPRLSDQVERVKS